MYRRILSNNFGIDNIKKFMPSSKLTRADVVIGAGVCDKPR